jgi:hypothetical protein
MEKSDIERLYMYERFIRRLLDPEAFGFAVSAEVRDEARHCLGMQKVETTSYAKQPYH